MFRPPIENVAQKRTLRPLYANHQATPHPGFLDPDLDVDFDILPGTVMARLYGEVFTPYTGQADLAPFGLSALFYAPKMNVNEVSSSGQGLFTVWRGDSQATFEVLAPAFDTEATWPAENKTGGRVLLTANSKGLLTPLAANADAAAIGKAIAELIDIPSPDKIVVQLNRFGPHIVQS